MDGLSIWIDQYIANSGDTSNTLLDDCCLINNKDTGHMTLWSIKEVFPDER